MTPFPSIASPRRQDRGGVSWVTALLLLVVATFVYLLIVWVPIYLVHYEVRQVVRDYINQAIKNRDDSQLVENLCKRLKALDTVSVTREDGTVEKVPAIQVEPSDVTWVRDTSTQPPTLHVAFEYTREVRYPYLSEVPREWVGSVDLQEDISVVDWGPSR